METFSGLLVLCVGNSPVTGEVPSQRPLHVLWRHCNEYHDILYSLALTDLEQISHFEFNTDTLAGEISYEYSIETDPDMSGPQCYSNIHGWKPLFTNTQMVNDN